MLQVGDRVKTLKNGCNLPVDKDGTIERVEVNALGKRKYWMKLDEYHTDLNFYGYDGDLELTFRDDTDWDDMNDMPPPLPRPTQRKPLLL